MRAALKSLCLYGHTGGCTKTTLNGLVRRGCATCDGEITDSGYEDALALLPLKSQCEQMGIPFMRISSPKPMGPELAVLMALDDLGVSQAAFDEGASLLSGLHASFWPRVSEHRHGPRHGLYVFAQLEVIRREAGDPEYMDWLYACLRSMYKPKFYEIAASMNRLYPPVESKKKASVPIARHLVDEVENNAGELRSFLASPYNARSGWPDIAVIHNSRLAWVEVKSSDKLIHSQIYNLLRLPRFLLSRMHVVQVVGKPGSPDPEDGLLEVLGNTLYL
ncbi:hypothetical protein SAMN04487952_1062 [Halomonas caseinilytica]|nr:hypothetical protein SAMN04487952_1062 [Halomonas caseinilytica]